MFPFAIHLWSWLTAVSLEKGVTCHLSQEESFGLPSDLLFCSQCLLLMAFITHSTNTSGLYTMCLVLCPVPAVQRWRHSPWVKELTFYTRDKQINVQLECSMACDMIEVGWGVPMRVVQPSLGGQATGMWQQSTCQQTLLRKVNAEPSLRGLLGVNRV